MATLRCTAKLLKRLGIRDPGEPPPPSNVLGDWFTNIVYTPQGHFILFVSERSLLPVISTARDLDNLVPRFERGLVDVLSELNVPQDVIEGELDRMQPLHFGRTNNASILASMNDYVQVLRIWLARGPDGTLLDFALRLAHRPSGAMNWQQPEDLAPRLFQNPHGFKVIEGGAV